MSGGRRATRLCSRILTPTERPMSEFVYLFRATQKEQQSAMGTPERAQQSLQAWLAWIRELETHGHLKNPGQPLDQRGRVVRGKRKDVSDGPFVEAKDMVLGFIIVEARDLTEATELAKGCPMLAGEASVEVRPVATFPA